jgi:nucleoside-diphosphate-sugar epimerase
VEKKLSLLIIGGTGFFGKSILDSFKRGLLLNYNIVKVIVLARNTDKFKLEYPELCFKGVEFINGDISNINFLPNAEFVIHAASSTNMIHYNDNSKNVGKNNIENSVSNYCKIAHKYHYKSKIIYCSSGAVYGKQPLDVEKIDENFKFIKDLTSLSIEKQNYCMGKRFAENEIKQLGNSGLNVSIARCFAFSGKYLPKDQHYAYGNFIGQAERGETVTVNSNGIVYRSYMDADKLVLSLLEILQIASTKCPILNVGSDTIITLEELAKKIAKDYNVNYSCPNMKKNIILDRYVPNTNRLKMLINNSIKI